MSTLFDPIAQARAAGAAAIDSPICNGPYYEPTRYWQVVDLATGERTEPKLIEGDRRQAGYFHSPQGSSYESSKIEEEFVPLECVNEIRRRVKLWREEGFRGVTPVTRRLLEHWAMGKPERENPLFYCQREAVETIIWLHEAHPADRQGLITTTVDGESVPLDKAHAEFLRYCCKMATGTGKTIVMGMIIAWSALNKVQYPQDTRFSDAVLIVAPLITVKDRLSVLDPKNEGNYYDLFELVPSALRTQLFGSVKLHIVHRQEMAIQDDTNKKGPRKLGPESDTAFANRLLKKDLGSKQKLLVLNDEGHHCYRPREKPKAEAEPALLESDNPTKEEAEENQSAAQWITGLEKIHRARTILTCIDLSATPFYIHGSGYPVGRPFPWIVSDFGLVDAIESGLVKIPQIPVDDNLGGNPPAYFHLWRWINKKLPAAERETARRKAKPEAIAREAEAAIVTMIGNWSKDFQAWQQAGSKVPPVMIVVTQEKAISKLIFDRLVREDFEFKEFVNTPERQVTYLYDSDQLKNAEEGEKPKAAEARLRAVMNTVGKEGQPGEHVRCISSVSMLTEGWDANNVTQIVGLRAFTSQLLCEQVVGRALRRRSYDVDPETGFLLPEYADVYGVPFQVIPVKAKGKGSSRPLPPSVLIRAIKEREHMELTFPRVEGYLTEIRERVMCDWDKLPRLEIAGDEPTQVWAKDVAGFRIGRPDIGGPGATELHDRIPFYLLARVSSACFAIASQILAIRIPGETEADSCKRSKLFPQVLGIVRTYVGEYLVFRKAPHEEVALEKWKERIVNVLNEQISEMGDDGAAIVMPRIERSRRDGSSKEVFFRTGRQVRGTLKSHVSHVVLDSTWESDAVTTLETSPAVDCYVRNDHLDFTIPYLDSLGNPHMHRPDFIVKLTNGLHVALEIKGQMRELDDYKIKAGSKWAGAVNRYYGERRWVYHPCLAPEALAMELQTLVS